MATIAPPQKDFVTLDQLILEALGELRSARSETARKSNSTNLDRQAQAEEHLNALLEYRHAAGHR